MGNGNDGDTFVEYDQYNFFKLDLTILLQANEELITFPWAFVFQGQFDLIKYLRTPCLWWIILLSLASYLESCNYIIAE